MKSIVYVLFAVALAASLRYENTFSAFEARYGKNYINGLREPSVEECSPTTWSGPRR